MQSLAPKHLLARWAGWYFLANTILLFLVGLSYISVIPDFSQVPGATEAGGFLAWSYLALSFVTQFGLAAFLLCLVTIGISWLSSRRGVVLSVGIFLGSILFIVFTLDRIVFHIYGMHLFGIGIQIISAGALLEVLPLSWVELTFLAVVIGLVILVEALLGLWVWRRVQRAPRWCGRTCAGVMLGCFLFSYGVTLSISNPWTADWLDAGNVHTLLKASRVVPYYNDVYNFFMPGDQHMRLLRTADGQVPYLVSPVKRPLHYPLQAMSYAGHKKLNIVILMIDTWRFDALNKTVTPYINHFAKQAWDFRNHWSGGNCTRPGVFSLFYGLPATYWDAAKQQRHGPVLIRALQNHGYQLGIFVSAQLNFPDFVNTVFADVQNLQIYTPGDSSIARDKAITKEFANFLAQRDPNKPFFSFVFYDSAHNYCEPAVPEKTPFKPYIKACSRVTLGKDTDPKPYLNRYLNAVHFDDLEVGKDLLALKKHGLLVNTIVIITADHGEEFNDSGLGLWGHASDYTKYQLKVPMIIYWPGKKPRVIHHFSSHYDIVPMLMRRVLQSKNPLRDYTIGQSLLTAHQPTIFPVSSYGDYAILQPHRIFRVYPNGDYEINYRSGYLDSSARPNAKRLRQAYQLLHRYFKQSV